MGGTDPVREADVALAQDTAGCLRTGAVASLVEIGEFGERERDCGGRPVASSAGAFVCYSHVLVCGLVAESRFVRQACDNRGAAGHVT